MYNLGSSWSFEIEFAVDNQVDNEKSPLIQDIFKVWQPLTPILTVSANSSRNVLAENCDIVVSLQTHLWPPTRIVFEYKCQNTLYLMRCTQDGSELRVELNGQVQKVRILDPVATGSVSVESRALSFDGFLGEDSVSVSSQELSERQEELRTWWSARPMFIRSAKDIASQL